MTLIDEHGKRASLAACAPSACNLVGKCARTSLARSPIELATSLEPCAKELHMAVNTCVQGRRRTRAGFNWD